MIEMHKLWNVQLKKLDLLSYFDTQNVYLYNVAYQM